MSYSSSSELSETQYYIYGQYQYSSFQWSSWGGTWTLHLSSTDSHPQDKNVVSQALSGWYSSTLKTIYTVAVRKF